MMHIKTLLITLFMFTLPLQGQYPMNPNLDPKLPLVPDKQYFEYKGMNSRDVTLGTLKAHDCARQDYLLANDPEKAMAILELIILVRKALEGIDIAHMSLSDREDYAQQEILKKLRAQGKDDEGIAWMEEEITTPSAGGLCHVLKEKVNSILRDKSQYYINFPDNLPYTLPPIEE